VTTVWLLAISLLVVARGRAEAEEEKGLLIDAISVEPGATCLDGLALVEHVRRWLGRDEIDKRIRVTVRGSDHSSTEATFLVDKGDGDPTYRLFTKGPKYCYDFHSAIGLSIAMAIDATYIEREVDYHMGESDTGGVRRKAFSLLLLRTMGVLTDASWGGFLALEMGWFKWLDLRIGAMFTYLGDQKIPQEPDAQFDTLLSAGRLDLCGAQTVAGAVRFRTCLGGLFGAFRTKGYNYDDIQGSRPETKPWGAVAMSAEFSINLLENFSIDAEADLVVPWWRRTIELEIKQGNEITRPLSETIKGVGGFLGIGPVIRF
jgi:hypothetical protein